MSAPSPNHPSPDDRQQAWSRVRFLTRGAVLAATGLTAVIGVVVAKEHTGSGTVTTPSGSSGSGAATTTTTPSSSGSTSSGSTSSGSSGSASSGSSSPSITFSSPAVTSGGSSR